MFSFVSVTLGKIADVIKVNGGSAVPLAIVLVAGFYVVIAGFMWAFFTLPRKS